MTDQFMSFHARLSYYHLGMNVNSCFLLQGTLLSVLVFVSLFLMQVTAFYY